ncbi:MAG: alpha-1,2-fucosyltransferase [Hydrogenophaga sp.]|nr:alpha-1,2-fucosyltransferase [Hydrogenophaga sp.]
MQKLAFYPRLSTPDLHLVRAPGPGLGNLLFPWARALMLAERDDGHLISPTWRNIKLGPILRRERDLRIYSDLFLHRHPRVLLSDLIIKLFPSEKIDEDEYLRNPRPALVVIEGTGRHFANLTGAGPLLRKRLTSMTLLPPKNRIDGIAMHIRTGDFGEHIEATYRRNSRVAVSWFVEEAKWLRQQLGDQPITIFTDDSTGAVRQAFSRVHNLSFANSGTAIHDILMMASAKHIVCSNSTFSLWAAFLSEATFSARFPELFSDYEFDSQILQNRLLSSPLCK